MYSISVLLERHGFLSFLKIVLQSKRLKQYRAKWGVSVRQPFACSPSRERLCVWCTTSQALFPEALVFFAFLWYIAVSFTLIIIIILIPGLPHRSGEPPPRFAQD